MDNIEFKVNDSVQAAEFIYLANEIWPSELDQTLISTALNSTLQITARIDGVLIGCLRLLTDGYLFSTIPEAFVLPDHQGKGIGTKLFSLAKEHSPTSLFFGAQPDKETFYLDRGFETSIQSFQFKKPRPTSNV